MGNEGGMTATLLTLRGINSQLRTVTRMPENPALVPHYPALASPATFSSIFLVCHKYRRNMALRIIVSPHSIWHMD
jgi:hypothetical protein